MSAPSPSPLRVVSLESRHAVEMVRLLTRHGCQAISAPSMREVPLQDQHEVLAFGADLLAGDCDVLLLLTGVGTRMLVDCLSRVYPRDAVVAALGRTQLVCRGPKPVAVLKALGLRATLVAPEPNTWHDVVALLDAQLPVAGRSVAVQEYGRTNQPLLEALSARGARLRTVTIYAWAMPDDTAPLAEAVAALCDGKADVVLFTSGQQLEHLLQMARELGREAQLRAALARDVLCASIGPVTSEALEAQQLTPELIPEHPKMGQLVLAVAQRAPQLVAAKRARR